MINRIIITTGFLLLSLTIFAQKTIKSAKIKYEITEVKGNPAAGEFLEGGEMTLTFRKDQYKTSFTFMDGGMEIASIEDGSTANATLVEVMGRKMKAVEAPSVKKDLPIFDFNQESDSIKTIAGYPCHYASYLSENGTKITAFVSDKIKGKHPYLETMFNGLEAWPLEYTVSNQDFSMTFRAVSINPKIDRKKAFLIPSNYEEKTPTEIKAEIGFLNFGL